MNVTDATRILAEQVMGWHWFEIPNDTGDGFWVGEGVPRIGEWEPFTRIEHAAMLQDTLIFQQGWLCTKEYNGALWKVTFWQGVTPMAQATTESRAISLAALRALGVTEEVTNA